MPTLAVAPAHVRLRIVGVAEGHEVARRLTELGVRPGAVVEVLGVPGRDPLLVSVGDARLAVGRGLAELVEVSVGADPDAGLRVDGDRLGAALGWPVVPWVARTGDGVDQLLGTAVDAATSRRPTPSCPFPARLPVADRIRPVAVAGHSGGLRRRSVRARSSLSLSWARGRTARSRRGSPGSR